MGLDAMLWGFLTTICGRGLCAFRDVFLLPPYQMFGTGKARYLRAEGFLLTALHWLAEVANGPFKICPWAGSVKTSALLRLLLGLQKDLGLFQELVRIGSWYSC